jgi:hypothetical protein
MNIKSLLFALACGAVIVGVAGTPLRLCLMNTVEAFIGSVAGRTVVPPPRPSNPSTEPETRLGSLVITAIPGS